MTKSKRRKPRDRLSELPDSLIFHIFWFLPMKYVVRTAVHSSRWKTLWTTTPYLNFDCIQKCNTDTAEPRNFVNRALLSWRGINILKFKIEFRYVDEEKDGSLVIDFALWIRFAVEKQVEELYLHGNEFNEDISGYEVPQWLYSCSSLKVLSLIGCYVQFNGSVPWSQLKSLTMNGGCVGNCEHVINQVLCGAPQLEVLILGIMENYENLSIRSTSLRKLSIKKFYTCTTMNTTKSTELRIWAPNLETLEILGDPYTKCLLMNVSSLTHATLDFYDTTDDTVEETLRHILPTIQHVEMVSLSSLCIEVLVHMIKKHLVSPFSNVKFLKLKIHSVGYEQVVGVLEIFPKMKMLVLLDGEDMYCRMIRSPKFDAKSCLKFVANLPESFLLQLRTVKINWAESDDSIFPFIEILLKYGSNLEKMVIRVTAFRPSSNSLFLASKKLLNMPRSSPNCTVDLL